MLTLIIQVNLRDLNESGGVTYETCANFLLNQIHATIDEMKKSKQHPMEGERGERKSVISLIETLSGFNSQDIHI